MKKQGPWRLSELSICGKGVPRPTFSSRNIVEILNSFLSLQSEVMFCQVYFLALLNSLPTTYLPLPYFIYTFTISYLKYVSILPQAFSTSYSASSLPLYWSCKKQSSVLFPVKLLYELKQFTFHLLAILSHAAFTPIICSVYYLNFLNSAYCFFPVIYALK